MALRMKKFHSFRTFDHSRTEITPENRHVRDNLRRWRAYGFVTFRERVEKNANGAKNLIVVVKYRLTPLGRKALVTK